VTYDGNGNTLDGKVTTAEKMTVRNHRMYKKSKLHFGNAHLWFLRISMLSFCLLLNACEQQTAITYAVESVEPTVLKITYCGKEFAISAAEKQNDQRIISTCSAERLFGAEIQVGNHIYRIEPGTSLYSARRAHLEIKLSETVVEYTRYDSLFCPNYDELCGRHSWTAFYSRKDGRYIRNPEDPQLSESQRQVYHHIIDERKTIERRSAEARQKANQ
jgi:hypothetical protein